MKNNQWEIFEAYLLNQYINNPNAELAEVLIKEYSAHIYKKSVCTKELQAWIEHRSRLLSKDSLNPSKVFGLEDKWSRSKTELKYLNMNVYTWQYLFSGGSNDESYHKTAILFSTTSEEPRIGFERKNHDFGSRELCRLSFDLFIAINKKKLKSNEIDIANKTLDEDIVVQMTKDYEHHRIKYRITQ